jgi:hypothetical protein
VLAVAVGGFAGIFFEEARVLFGAGLAGDPVDVSVIGLGGDPVVVPDEVPADKAGCQDDDPEES